MAESGPTAASDNAAVTRLKSTRRNDSCPCGSGTKYKRCHLAADELAERGRLAALQQQAEAALAAAAAEEEEEDAATKKKPTAAAVAGKGKLGTPAVGKGAGRSGKPNNLPRRKAI